MNKSFLRDSAILLGAVLLIFGGYFFLGLGSLHPDVQGDFKIYLAMAQAMDGGAVLYQGAADTKNMGFFAFFFGFYKAYRLFFADLAYIYLWAHLVLTLIYFFMALMIYQIVQNLGRSRLWGLGSAVFALLYVSLLEHAYILNQPQIALLWALAAMLFLSKGQVQGKRSFFLLGLLLGGGFAFASPYLVLVLIVPFLCPGQRLKEAAFICLSALGGFLLAILPFFIYFAFHGALAGWFYFNVQFLTVKADFGTPIPLIKPLIGVFFTLGNHPQTLLLFTVTAGAFGLWLVGAKKIFVKNTSLRAVAVFALLSLFTRLLLSLHHSSYQFYALPFLVIIPAILARPSKGLWLGLGLWGFLALKAPAPYLESYPSPAYGPQTLAILSANAEKTPLFTASPGFYNFGAGVSTEHFFYLSSARIIAKRRPELVFGAPTASDYLQTLARPKAYERGLLQNYPLPEGDFFAKNYSQVTPLLFIRNDALPEWKLDVLPPAAHASQGGGRGETAPPEPEPWLRRRLKLPEPWKAKMRAWFGK